jgi:hypothetical protein
MIFCENKSQKFEVLHATKFNEVKKGEKLKIRKRKPSLFTPVARLIHSFPSCKTQIRTLAPRESSRRHPNPHQSSICRAGRLADLSVD